MSVSRAFAPRPSRKASSVSPEGGWRWWLTDCMIGTAPTWLARAVRLLFWWMLSEVSTAILSGWYLVSVWLYKPLAYLAWVCHSRAEFFLGWCCGFSTLTSGLVHTRLAVAT